MVNPFDYLYYKVYSALSYISGGGNPITHAGAVGLLLLSNAVTIYILITGRFSSTFAYCCVGILSITSLITLLSKREEKILNKYKNESDKSRLIGNVSVVVYVLVSAVLFAFAMKSIMPEKKIEKNEPPTFQRQNDTPQTKRTTELLMQESSESNGQNEIYVNKYIDRRLYRNFHW